MAGLAGLAGLAEAVEDTTTAPASARDALAAGARRLGAGRAEDPSDTPHLDAEVLLRHVLGMSRAALFATPERALTLAEAARYAALLTRRAAGEPVAYLTGRREFMGLEFHVDRRVLVPRPETELLVERALAAVATATATATATGPVRAADVGTGSGAVAVSLASHAPGTQVVATDTSAAALAVARQNARLLVPVAPGESERVWLVRCRTLSAVRGPFAVIVANLPYIRSAAMADLPRTVREYEPWGALDGGADGLEAYRALLPEVPARLTPGGTLLMECDPAQAGPLGHLAVDALPDATVTAVRDLAGLERVVVATRR